LTNSLADIKIQGNDAEVDSFAACIAAAIDYWGRGFDYVFVAGLSGSVFSPTLNESESCTAWWTEFGNDSRVKFLGNALGFTSKTSPDFKGDKPGREIEDFWDLARDSVLKGKVVVTGTWPCWSIVTDWSDDLFAPKVVSLPAVAGIVKPRPSDRIYILTEGTATMTRNQALREALKFGADIAEGKYSLPGHSFGGKLYEAMARHLADENYCPDCLERSYNCALRTLERIHGVNFTAVQFIEHAGMFLGRQIPQPAVAAVMRGCQEIADLASKYLDHDAFKQNWPDPGFRSQLISDIRRMSEIHFRTSKLLRNMVENILEN
jgi:hypothetical protein